jgi:hypothetical protein
MTKAEGDPVRHSVENLLGLPILRKDLFLHGEFPTRDRAVTPEQFAKIEQMAHWAPRLEIKSSPSYGKNHGRDEIPGVERWLKRMYELGHLLGEELGLTPEEYVDSAPKLEFNNMKDLRNEEGIPIYVETRLPIERLLSKLNLGSDVGLKPFLDQTSDEKPYIARMDGVRTRDTNFQELRSQVRQSGNGASLHEAVAFVHQAFSQGLGGEHGAVLSMGSERDGIIPVVGVYGLFTIDANSDMVNPGLWALTSKRP